MRFCFTDWPSFKKNDGIIIRGQCHSEDKLSLRYTHNNGYTDFKTLNYITLVSVES